MSRRAGYALLVILLAAGAAPGQQWARKMFKTRSHDFGTVARGAKAEFVFEFTNSYIEDLHVAGVRSSCGCTAPQVPQKTIKTWETGRIVCPMNTRSFLGHKTATVTVTFDKPYIAEVQLSIAGNIRGDVVLDPGVVDFGALDQGTAGERRIKISYAGRHDWSIVDVRSANPHFEVELKETQRGEGLVGYDMVVRLKPDAPAGYFQDQLTLVTDEAGGKPIPVPVSGRVVAGLTVSPDSLFLGVVQPGQRVTRQLVIRGNKPFRIVDIKCQDGCFEFDKPEGAKTMHLVPITFTAPGDPGKVVERIQIETDLGPGTMATCVATATVKSN